MSEKRPYCRGGNDGGVAQDRSPGAPGVHSSGPRKDVHRRWRHGPQRTLDEPRYHLRQRVGTLAWQVMEGWDPAFACGAGTSVQE